MLEELVSILAIGVAAAALFVHRRGSARDSMRTMTRNLPGHAGDALLRSGTLLHKKAYLTAARARTPRRREDR